LQNFFSELGVKPSSFGKTLKTREHKYVQCIARLPRLIIEVTLQSSIGAGQLGLSAKIWNFGQSDKFLQYNN
jgi:hypothetical protein